MLTSPSSAKVATANTRIELYRFSLHPVRVAASRALDRLAVDVLAEAALPAVTTSEYMNLFLGKNALITGGSSGIGLAIARQIAGAGAHVTLLARNIDRLQAAQQQVKAACLDSSQRISIISAELTNAEQVSTALAQTTPPDFLFNVAGEAHPGVFEELNLDIFHWMMAANYFSTLYVIKAVLPAMIQRKSGHIINFSSVAGYLGVYGYSAYGPAKFAVRGLSDVLRSELADHKIRLSVVFPPDTRTPQLEYENQFKPEILKILDESNKVMEPGEVARQVLRAVARGQYIITPGFDATIFFHLNNFLGSLSYRVMDLMVAQARRKAQSAKKHSPQ